MCAMDLKPNSTRYVFIAVALLNLISVFSYYGDLLVGEFFVTKTFRGCDSDAA